METWEVSQKAWVAQQGWFRFLFVCLFVFNLFIYFWLCWVFVSVHGLSLVAASGGHSSSQCAGLSLSRPLLLWSTGSRRAGSAIAAHGPSCSTACGIFPDQGSNPCPLHWGADSQPLRHQESPWFRFLNKEWHAASHPRRNAPLPPRTFVLRHPFSLIRCLKVTGWNGDCLDSWAEILLTCLS